MLVIFALSRSRKFKHSKFDGYVPAITTSSDDEVTLRIIIDGLAQPGNGWTI